MRKTLKILHTIAGAGLIGGLGCYMVLLVMAPQDTASAYVDLRQSIAAISNYVLLPSLAIGILTGLLSMVVHTPFLDKGWVWAKAAMGLLMFKGVLTIIGAKANHAAVVSQNIADGEAAATVLDSALAQEWYTLLLVMALSVANVVLGIWRPRHLRRPHAQTRSTLEAVPDIHVPAADDERSRPAA